MAQAHGLLLTGGRSSRMGEDKALLAVDGIPLAQRVARALAVVSRPVLAVGSEAGTGLEVVEDPREGPLSAFAAGAAALAARGCHGPILLVACDLPFLTARLLGHLAASLAGADAVVPVAGGRDQPLAACYAPAARDAATGMLAQGKRAMHELLEVLRVRRMPEAEWASVASPDALADVDTPADLDRARRRTQR